MSSDTAQQLQYLLENLWEYHYSCQLSSKTTEKIYQVNFLTAEHPGHFPTTLRGPKPKHRARCISSSTTPPKKLKMRMKESDDYLTARAANPRTGLVSPSIMTMQTPRTPMTPGEAIRLYGNWPSQSPSFAPGGRFLRDLGSPQKRHKHQQPANRWRQHEKGWIMETVTEIASPRMTMANTSITRITSTQPKDRFVMPMPSAREPQPYSTTGNSSLSMQAFNRDEPGLNERVLSIGAGPRKSMEASKALRTKGARPGSCATDAGPFNDTPSSSELSTLFTHRPSTRSASNGSEDSVITAVKDMPGGFNVAPPSSSIPAMNTPLKITRKPVGSPPRKQERRDSNATVCTATSADEKEVHSSSATIQTPSRIRSNSNTTRFQDLRQLPRVRLIHPDLASTLHPDPAAVAAAQHAALPLKRVFTLTDPPSSLPSQSEPPWQPSQPGPPRPRYQHSTPSPTPSTTTPANPLSPLESHLVALLTWLLALPLQWTYILRTAAPAKTTLTILRAIEAVSDANTEPAQRLHAAKVLVVAGGRTMVVVGVMVAVVRIGVVVRQVLEVVVWPLGVLVAVVRWLVDFG